MKFNYKNYIFIAISIHSFYTLGQGTFPIFSDYLSDNVYLLHPAAAGIGNCGKIRVTAGNYWKGNELQTASFHAKFNQYSKAAFGVIFFNDKNGYHSQKGFEITYAYHINMTKNMIFKKLSFGISFSIVQNQLDQRSFFSTSQQNTIQQLIKSEMYQNVNFGIGYHYKGLSSYFTIKNLFLSAKKNTNINSLNFRNYILGVGYFFGDKEKVEFEPSFMLQYKEHLNKKIIDLNMKVYKTLNKKYFRLWGVLSYRRSFDRYSIQPLQGITSVIGIDYKRWVISYTYTKPLGSFHFNNAGFHQVTVGINLLFNRTDAAACPNINNSF